MIMSLGGGDWGGAKKGLVDIIYKAHSLYDS